MLERVGDRVLLLAAMAVAIAVNGAVNGWRGAAQAMCFAGLGIAVGMLLRGRA